MNPIAKPDPQSNYISKFNAFLDSKLHQQHQEKVVGINDRSLSSEIHKRFSRLKPSNAQDRKINHIMENFKNVSTYVDIKDFIVELRAEPGKKKEVIVEEDGESTGRETKIGDRERTTSQAEMEERLKAITYGPCPNMKLIEHQSFVTELKNNNNTKLSQQILCDYSPTDPFELKLYNYAINDHDQYKRSPNPKKGHRKHTKSHTLPSQEEGETSNVDTYKKQLSKISGEMHSYLENMYTMKWNKKQKQKEKVKKDVVEEKGEKPLMDIKYKYHAPKGVFEFVDKSKPRVNRNKVKINRSTDNLCFDPSSTSTTLKLKQNNRSSLKLPPNDRNFAIRPCPSKLHPLKPKQQLHPSLPQSAIRSLKTMKQIKHRYNFKKPEIKNTILKKIIDFIDDIENNQFIFRKTNVNILNSINEIEAKNTLDYERIIEDSVDLEELRNSGNRFRKAVI